MYVYIHISKQGWYIFVKNWLFRCLVYYSTLGVLKKSKVFKMHKSLFCGDKGDILPFIQLRCPTILYLVTACWHKAVILNKTFAIYMKMHRYVGQSPSFLLTFDTLFRLMFQNWNIRFDFFTPRRRKINTFLASEGIFAGSCAFVFQTYLIFQLRFNLDIDGIDLSRRGWYLWNRWYRKKPVYLNIYLVSTANTRLLLKSMSCVDVHSLRRNRCYRNMVL